MTDVKLLVRTPRQQPLESPVGFLNRLAEVNGYKTALNVLQLAGMTRDDGFCLRLNLQKLAAVLGRRGDDLHGYCAVDGPSAGRVRLCGHDLPSREIAIGKPKICPQCVRENGYVYAWNDLALVDGCPIHRRELATSCPRCSIELQWSSPGLLTCRCGMDLSTVHGAPIAADHALVLDYIAAKFRGTPVGEALGAPHAHMQAMSLARMLCWMRGLGLLYATAVNGPVGLLKGAARLLVNWPRQFHVALSLVLPNGADGPGEAKMRAHVGGVYRTLMRNLGDPADVALLRDALATFPDKCDSIDEESWTSGEEQIACAQCISPPAKMRRVRGATGRRPVASAQQSMGLRQAASMLRMPASVLVQLRQSGHFEVRHKASRVAAFHEEDVQAFKSKVIQLAHSTMGYDCEGISIREVFGRKFKHANGKSLLLASVMDGDIPVLGSNGPDITDLVIDRAQFENFLLHVRQRAFRGAVTPTEVAAQLGCDGVVIPSLVRMGLLSGSWGAAGLRVTPDSVARFKEQYVPLSVLAVERGTSSRALAALAGRLGIELLWAKRDQRTIDSRQPFIKIDQLPRLAAAVA